MGGNLLWTAVALFLINMAFPIPASEIVVAVLAGIGVILLWLGR